MNKDIFSPQKLLEIYDFIHPAIPLFILYMNFDSLLTQTIKTLMGSLFIYILFLQIIRFILIEHMKKVLFLFSSFFIYNKYFFYIYIKNLFICILYFIFSYLLVHSFIIFYGAPVVTYVWETTLCALHLTILGILPAICIFGINTEKYAELVSLELNVRILQNFRLTYGFLGTFIGAWLGAIPIPLDWDRTWQKWPIPIIIGGYLGYAFSIFILLFNYLKKYSFKT